MNTGKALPLHSSLEREPGCTVQLKSGGLATVSQLCTCWVLHRSILGVCLMQLVTKGESGSEPWLSY